MGRRKKGLWIPKDVSKMANILSLFLDKHAVGFFVLCGKCPWPNLEELGEMLRCVNDTTEETGVHIQGGVNVSPAQRRVEAIESAECVYKFLERYGGHSAVARAVKEYSKVKPRECELLRRIGTAGMPGAKSLEALAGEYHMNIKTLYAYKHEAIKNIACIVVYSGNDFELAG